MIDDDNVSYNINDTGKWKWWLGDDCQWLIDRLCWSWLMTMFGDNSRSLTDDCWSKDLNMMIMMTIEGEDALLDEYDEGDWWYS